MDKALDVLLWRPAAASLLPHVGFASSPGVWYLPSGGWICHLKLTGYKPLKMAESLYCLCDSAKRQMVAETACGTASDCTQQPLCMSKHTHRATGKRSVSLALTDDSAAPPGELRAPAWCVSIIGRWREEKKNGLSSGYLFCSICRGVEQGGCLRKATDIRANLARKAQNQKICWVYLLLAF